MKIRVSQVKNSFCVLGTALAGTLLDLLSKVSSFLFVWDQLCTPNGLLSFFFKKKKRFKIIFFFFCILSLADYSGSISIQAEHEVPEEHIKQYNKAQQ